jgi:hypothetical protein
MAEHEQAMTTKEYVDKHGYVDQGVDDVNQALDLEQHPLAIIPREYHGAGSVQ